MEIKGHVVIGKACNGIECIEKISNVSHEPDFIIMDHQMPGKNGLETMKELLKNRPNLKIIFVSGDKEIKDQALNMGAVSFIQKPFNMQTFFHSISHLMI